MTKNAIFCKAKVLITTGIAFGPTATSSEVIDFSEESNVCENFIDFPIITYGATGQMTNLPIICGGENSDVPATDSCFTITKDKTEEIVSMSKPRSGAASLSILNHSKLWITGGLSGGFVADTEIIDFVQNTTSPGIDLPLPMYGHCLVQINETTILLIGGKSSEVLSRTYFLQEDSEQWVSGPELEFPRYLHSCGMQGNSLVVVSGGRNENDLEMDAVEMLDLKSLEWISGNIIAVERSKTRPYDKFGNKIYERKCCSLNFSAYGKAF